MLAHTRVSTTLPAGKHAGRPVVSGLSRMLSFTGVLQLLVAVGVSDVAAAPKIFCAAPIHDFGAISNTEKVQHEFHIQNQGESPLLIEKLKPGCGCTVANISAKTVEPGETATIRAQLDLRRKEGKQEKTIEVFSNDPARASMNLMFTGVSMAIVSATPQRIAPATLRAGQLTTNDVIVISLEEAPLVLSVLNTGNDHVRAEVVELPGSSNAQVRVTTDGKLPLGPTYGRISIRTNSESKPTVTIPYVYQVAGEISVHPPKLSFVLQDKALTQAITVGPGLIKEFDVTGVESPDKSVQVQIQKLRESRFRITLKNIIPREDLNEKSFKILTTAKNMAVVEVPITVISPN